MNKAFNFSFYSFNYIIILLKFPTCHFTGFRE